MDPYIDVWVPHLDKLTRTQSGLDLAEYYKTLGEPVYTYTCRTNMKGQSAYRYHRLKPWQAAQLGLDGVFYWAYNSWRGDPWDDFDGPIADCGAIYNATGGPITSRRWEASREGIEDWQIMRLVEGLARGDAPAADRARKLIAEALETVLTRKDELDLANAYRLKLIEAAAALAAADPLSITAVGGKMDGRDLSVTFKTNRPASGKLLYRLLSRVLSLFIDGEHVVHELGAFLPPPRILVNDTPHVLAHVFSCVPGTRRLRPTQIERFREIQRDLTPPVWLGLAASFDQIEDLVS